MSPAVSRHVRGLEEQHGFGLCGRYVSRHVRGLEELELSGGMTPAVSRHVRGLEAERRHCDGN